MTQSGECLRDMRERLKKLAGWRPGHRVYAVVAAAALLLLLCPLIRLALYSVPWYDDYNYGRFARTAMADAPTLGNALKGAWECIRISWYAWQGTYGSIFFMTLMPGIWGEEYYCIGPIFLILLLMMNCEPLRMPMLVSFWMRWWMAAPLTLQVLATSKKGMRASSAISFSICLSKLSNF